MTRFVHDARAGVGLGCVLGVLLAGAPTACGAPTSFACTHDEQCVQDMRSGRCEANGYCSFPDGDCMSGSRYANHAPSGVAGTCVVSSSGDDGAEIGDDDPGVSTNDPVSTTSGTEDDDNGVTSTTGAVSDATHDTTVTSGTASGSGAPSETTDDAPDSSTGTGSSTIDPDVDPYAYCLSDGDCEYPGATCMVNTWALPLCNPDCSGANASDECPPPTEGTATPACRDITSGEWRCVLDCAGKSCPEGMFCSPTTIGSFCIW